MFTSSTFNVGKQRDVSFECKNYVNLGFFRINHWDLMIDTTVAAFLLKLWMHQKCNSHGQMMGVLGCCVFLNKPKYLRATRSQGFSMDLNDYVDNTLNPDVGHREGFVFKPDILFKRCNKHTVPFFTASNPCTELFENGVPPMAITWGIHHLGFIFETLGFFMADSQTKYHGNTVCGNDGMPNII